MHFRPLTALFLSSALVATLVAIAPATAQQAAKSAPAAQPVIDTVPDARDTSYPGGTIKLEVDATDTTQRIFRVKETIPVAGSGPLTLLMPQWLPGNHAPRGQIEKLAGIHFLADGKEIGWSRDPLNVYAFHLNVPEGTNAVTAQFQFLSATDGDQGRVVVTPKMLNLQWEAVSLYPAGFYTRRIAIQPTVTYPTGWTAATALRGTKSGSTIAYETTDYETLVDSPVFAGEYFKSADLGQNVTLNIVADNPAELAVTPEQIAAHKKLVDEAVSLFGARHFDHYDFLFAITDEMGGIGLEHHRSSENGVKTGYFTKWNDGLGSRNLLPHEFVHSWDGKFRRGADLWTPDFATPMQNSLLWVYEGQTQFWGYVLGARSGLYSKQQSLDAIASIAARLDTTRGRQWRSVEDTTNDPIISARRPKGWSNWQRSEDYYNEGMLTWLEADAIMRKQSAGAKGMDDFAKAFFGINDGDWGEVTYTRQDVIDTLNSIVPYDWASFINQRIDQPSQEAPKNGITMGGYALVYGDTPNSVTKTIESGFKGIDQSYGVGLMVKDSGEIGTVIWDSAAFKAGLTVGMKIMAVNGREYARDEFRDALASKKPVELIVKQDKYYRIVHLDYSDGLRYPRLEKIGEGEGSLDRLLQPRT